MKKLLLLLGFLPILAQAQLQTVGAPVILSGGTSGGGGGSGTVTSVSVTSANGFRGTVANPTTTPAISVLGPPGLFPNVAAANQNLVFEGDSLSIAGTWTDTNFNLRPWAVNNTTSYIIATSGQVLSGIVARYTASVFPLRPTGSITSSYLYVFIGANDIVAGVTASAWLASWNSYCAQARTDGFKVIAFTILPRGTDPAVETLRQQINLGIRTSANYDMLIETAEMFPDSTDLTWYNVDQIHLNAAADLRLAAFINSRMVAADAIPLPPSVTVGVLDSNVPSNALLKSQTHTFTAAQGNSMTTLVDSSTISWDASANQVAHVTLGGNRAIANPANMVAGFWYTLLVSQDATGSRTLTYGAKYKWPGSTAPTLSTTASYGDLFRFLYDGTNLIGSVVGQNYNITVPTPYVISEQFDPTGSDQNMNGTPADTLDVPGGNWAVLAGTATRVNSTGKGSLDSNSLVVIDSGISNGTFRCLYYPAGGFGGVVFRETDSTHYWVFLVQNTGTNDWTLYKNNGGLSLVLSGTGLTVSGGKEMKVVASGSSITVYWDGSSLGTVTDAFNSTATKIGLNCFNGISVDDFTGI